MIFSNRKSLTRSLFRVIGEKKMNRLLKAIDFAAQKHSKQRRKNQEASPYINHPIEVAAYLSDIGEIDDEDVIVAALLHDTIEDTETSEMEIVSLFGNRVANLVLECTDDKSLEKQERKRLQIVNAPKKSPEAKLIKIADKICNLRSVISDPPKGWSTLRQLDYFKWAEKVTLGLLGENQRLDEDIQTVLKEGIGKLK